MHHTIFDVIKKNPFLLIFAGMLCVFLAFPVSFFSAGRNASIYVLGIASLLAVPFMSIFINRYDQKKVTVAPFLFLSAGLFLGFLFLAFFTAGNITSFSNVFTYEKDLVMQNGELDANTYLKSIQEYTPKVENLVAILTNNLTILITSLVLSLFYGAGAVFLLALNTGTFALFLYFVITFIAKNVSQGIMVAGTFMMHLIPELLGFFVAAIAGAMISKGMLYGVRSNEFKENARQAILFILISIALVVIAGFIEVYVSAVAMKSVA